MWWLDAESPSGYAAAHVPSAEQASQQAEAVKQLRSELAARDKHIAAQSAQFQRLQVELKEQAAVFARQHELAHRSRRAAQTKLGKTQSRLFAVIDRHQAERAEQVRTSQVREQQLEQQLAVAKSQQRELEAGLAQHRNSHSVAQANFNSKLGWLEHALSEQQRAAREQLEQYADQVAQLKAHHANRLTTQLATAQAAQQAALVRAQQTELQHAATVERLTAESTARGEQLATCESRLAETLSDQRLTKEKLTAQAAALQTQLDQSRASEARLIQQAQQTKQQYDQLLVVAKSKLAERAAEIERHVAIHQRLSRELDRALQQNFEAAKQLSQRAAAFERFATGRAQRERLLVAEIAVLRHRGAELQSALADRGCDAEALHEMLARRTKELQQSQHQNASLQTLLVQQESEIRALREAMIKSTVELERSKNENAELQSTLSARDAELVHLHRTIAQQQATLAQVKQVNSELQAQIASIANAHTELVVKLEQQMLDAGQANVDARARQQQLQRQYALDVQSLQSTIAQLEQKTVTGRACFEELEAKLFAESEARKRLSNECTELSTELNRVLAEHRSSSQRAEAAASTRLAEAQQQQAIEVANLRATLRTLELSLQKSSNEKETLQAERESAVRQHAAEIERQAAIHKRLSGELDQALQQNDEAAKQLSQRATTFERFVAGAHHRERLLVAEIASLRHRDAELRQAGVQLVRRLDDASASLKAAAESEGSLREQLGSLARQYADLQERLEAADRAECDRSAEQSSGDATTWISRLQKESAARRKAESALRRAADAADDNTIARVARVELDARQQCERLAAELVATRALAAKAQRRLTSDVKRAQEEVMQLRSKLDGRQAAGHTIPMSGKSGALIAEPEQLSTRQSKAS